MRTADVAVVALAFVSFANAATIQSDGKALSKTLRCAGAKVVTDSEFPLAVTALQGLATCIQKNANFPYIQGWGVNTSSDPCSRTLPWTGIECTATSNSNTVTTL